MKLANIFVAVGLCLLSTSFARAEDAKGIPGRLMPDGTFRPVPPPRANTAVAPEAVTVVRAGFINVAVTIQVFSGAAHLLPSTIKCELALSVFDTDGTNTNEIRESDFYPATVAGTAGKCDLKIPYYWNLYNPAGDAININVAVRGLDASNRGRTSFLTLPPIPVPATGAVTNLTVTTRL